MGRPLPRQSYAAAPSTSSEVRENPLSVADALFTSSQQRILGLLFGQPAREFSVSELISESGAGSGATQRELGRLAASGLVSVHIEGTTRRYSANPYGALFQELVAIVRKAVDATPQLPLLSPRPPRKSSNRNHA